MQDMLIDGVVVTRRSTLDYVFSPAAQDHRVLSLEIAEDHDLESDHKPLVLSFAWRPPVPSPKKNSSPMHRKWLIEDLNPVKLRKYDTISEQHMQTIWHSLQEHPDVASKAFNDSITTAAELVIGSKLVGKTSKPGFGGELRSLVRQRQVLRSAVDAVANSDPAMASSLRDKLTVLRSRLRSKIRSQRVSSLNDTCRSIVRSRKRSERINWKRWRAHSQVSSHRIPEMVVDLNGNIVTDPAQVLQVWRRFGEHLGRDDLDSAEDQDTLADTGDRISNRTGCFDDEFARATVNRLRELSFGDELCVPELDRIVTWDEVHCAVISMADGKAADLQGIVLELIKLAGIAARVALAKLFNNVWNRLLWPAAWHLAFMIPLYKDSVKMDPNNYRLLAIGAVVPKIFEKILDIRLRRYLERTGKLSDLQGLQRVPWYR
jgi:hypothetical protein